MVHNRVIFIVIFDICKLILQVFVPLAMSFGFHFAGKSLWDAYNDVQHLVETGNFDDLPELHALSCGLKALVTQESADAIDLVRRSCGGHGFMCSSNLPRLWGLVTASCTYEGENTVMQLQVRLQSNTVTTKTSPGGNIF